MPPPMDRFPRGGYLQAATMARASSASMTIGATIPIAPESSTILMYSCLPVGTRASGTQPASAIAANMYEAVGISVWVCSKSTVSQGSPTRAMNRAAATLPSVSQVPNWGLPARNARLTGFSFNSVPRHRRDCGSIERSGGIGTDPPPVRVSHVAARRARQEQLVQVGVGLMAGRCADGGGAGGFLEIARSVPTGLTSCVWGG